jgi:hypothetical protein
MGIWDDLTGASSAAASNAAAEDTFRKQKKAGQDLRAYGNQYANQYSNLATMFAPYASAGGEALNMYKAGLGLDGGAGAEAFTAAYRGLPGYESGLRTGTNAAIAGANAGGRLNSGATMKALQRFGSDYEDQRVGSHLDRLMGLTGMGQQATGQQVATTGQGLQGQLGTRTSAYGGDMQAAGTVGQGMVAGAQAQQQGMSNLLGAATYLGGAALGGGLGGTSALTNLFKPAAQTSSYQAAPGNFGTFNWGGQQYSMAR